MHRYTSLNPYAGRELEVPVRWFEYILLGLKLVKHKFCLGGLLVWQTAGVGDKYMTF